MDDNINWFQYFHAYKRFVKEGKVKPIVCPWDSREYVIGHMDGKLILVCYECGGVVYPGLDLLSRVRAVVKEHTND